MSRSTNGPSILRLTISAADGADDDRLKTTLVEIAAQDSSVSFSTQPEGPRYSLEGRTESDLDSICDRLRDEYHLAINVGPPTAILVETIRKEAEAEGKYIRQIGGSGNYGHCKIRIEPDVSARGYEFINGIRSGAVPSEYIESIDQGIQAAMRQGVLAGCPMVDIRVTLCDGSYHETDSNPVAFTFAGSIAFKEAAKKASPVLLEPMMEIEIVEVPAELSDVIRDEVYTHRGRVEHEGTTDGWSEIKAVVPLSELLASPSRLLAEFAMEFAGYEAVRNDGSSDENGSGVTANRPNRPKPRSRSETTRPEPESD